MSDNEKRLFADIPCENEKYVRVMRTSKRSGIFVFTICLVFGVVLGIVFKDLLMTFLVAALAVLFLASAFRTKMLLKKYLIIYEDKVEYNLNGYKDMLLEMKPEDYSIEVKLKRERGMAGYSLHFIFRNKSDEKLLEYVSYTLHLPVDPNAVESWQADILALECEIKDLQGIF